MRTLPTMGKREPGPASWQERCIVRPLPALFSLLVLCAAGFCLLVSLVPAPGADQVAARSEVEPLCYQVEGVLTEESYHFSGRVFGMRYKFLVAVSNRLWKIVSSDDQYAQVRPPPPGPASPKTYRHLKVHTDGLDWFAVFYYSTNPSLAFAPGPEVTNISASVRKGSVPSDAGQQVIWMAFASASVLDSTPGLQLPNPWQGGMMRPLITNFQVHLERAAMPPGLPLEAVFSMPGFYYDEQGNRVPYPKPYDDGWVFARYEVLRWTNWGGATLPLEFVFRRFGRKDDASASADTELLGQYRGEVRSVIATAPAFTEPPVPQVINVHDYRFKDDTIGLDSLPLQITNENWLPADSPALVAKLQDTRAKVLARIGGPRTPPKWRSLGLLLVLAASAVFPAFFLLRRGKRQNLTTTNH
jgi:hypothetical protein